MLLQNQLILEHDPDKKIYGDCYRTCIANLLDLPVDSVPNFAENTEPDKFHAAVEKWLNGRRLTLLGFAYSDCDLAKAIMKSSNPGRYYILSGQTSRGHNHAVVYRDDEVIKDPHPAGGDLCGPCSDGYYFVEILGHLSKPHEQK